jgi:IS1 family transposase
MFTCSEYARRLEGELRKLEAQYGKLNVYSEIGDLSEMYTNLFHADCDTCLIRNARRYRESTQDIGGHNLRCRERICMPRKNT